MKLLNWELYKGNCVLDAGIDFTNAAIFSSQTRDSKFKRQQFGSDQVFRYQRHQEDHIVFGIENTLYLSESIEWGEDQLARWLLFSFNVFTSYSGTASMN